MLSMEEPMSTERSSRIVGIVGVVSAILLVAGWAVPRPRSALVSSRVAPAIAPSQPPAKTIADFLALVKQYVAIHLKHESSLTALPKDASPLQIDQRQRALAELVRTARAGAKRGDLFTTGMTAYIRQVLKGVFAGADGKKLRAEILDEYPGGVVVKVNDRYPDVVPLANMPAAVLEALPKLPEELEYRFVGEQLILLDPHAHIIADFIINALPGQ